MRWFFYIRPGRRRLLSLALVLFICISGVLYFNQEPSINKLSTQKAEYSPPDSNSWRQKAQRMVRMQIEERGLTDDKVLEVMRETPRHLFVPKGKRNKAYRDRPLGIGHGQTISQPYIVALMTAKLKLTGHEKVLEIGTGSGYQAAVLAQLADSVYTMEIVKALAQSARETLKKLNYDNVVVKHGNGYKGWPEHAPFDAIMVTAAPDQVPQALKEQLKVGGRMIIPVGTSYQKLTLLTKQSSDEFKREMITPVRFVPMVDPE